MPSSQGLRGRASGLMPGGDGAHVPCRRRSACGALAQLGERLICIQEVIGSIPIGSTKTLRVLVPPIVSWFAPLRGDRLRPHTCGSRHRQHPKMLPVI
jgi:hypothetical protein